MMSLMMLMPVPRPACSLAVTWVENFGSKIRLTASLLLKVVAFSASIMPRLTARCLIAGRSRPAPSSRKVSS